MISTGSLVFALVSGGYALVRNEINTVKEQAATDRQSIRHQLEENDRATEALRHSKLDVVVFDRALARLAPASEQMARIDDLQRQITAINNRIEKIVSALDNTYSMLNEHMRRGHDGNQPNPPPLRP